MKPFPVMTGLDELRPGIAWEGYPRPGEPNPVTGLWLYDLETRERVWNLLKNGPEPVGYDPAIIPGWNQPSDDAFAALRLDPWRLRVFPGSVLMGQGGEVLTWNE